MFSRFLPALAACLLALACGTPARAQTGTPTTNALADALDAPALAFASTGTGAWFSQKTVTSDGVDAVRSGSIAASGKSTLTVSVTGITKFSFKWRVSSESNRDILTFYIDDVAQTSPISGNVGWQTRTYTLSGTGSHTLRWEYAKDSSVNSGSDAAWVDQFTILETSVPFITKQPASLAVAAGDNAVLSVDALGSGTLTYQWYQGESNNISAPVAGATGPSLLTPPLTATTRYWVKISKDTQSVGSSAAVLTVSARTPQTLLATGASLEGALGLGDTKEIDAPARAAISVIRSAAGARHSLFLKSDGSLWAMGDNADGQLGDGSTDPRSNPVRLVTSGVVQIAAGESHSLFLKTDGTVWGMGSDADGQLGLANSSADVVTPVQILANVAQISAGSKHSLFVKTDGTLWATGDHGGAASTDAPVEIASQVAFATAGKAHSLFIKNNGALWAWGANGSGQLGDGTTEDRDAPVLVASRVAFASAGGDHSLFVRSDGFLLAMGSHAHGQLGAGSLADESVSAPKQIAAGVTRAAAGARHSFFLKSDGTLWAMGDNSDGQLGDGGTTNRFTPVQVAAGVLDASAGEPHSLILRTPVLYSVTFALAGGTRTGGGALKQSVREGEAAFAPIVSGPNGNALHEWSADFSTITGPLVVQAIYRAAQKITFDPIPSKTFAPPTDSINLTASSDSGLPVVLTVVSGPGYTAGTVLPGKTLTYESGGLFVIRATAAAGENDKGTFAAATPVERTIEIKKLTQTLTFNPVPPTDVTYGAAPITLSATTSAPDLAVTYKVVSGPATVVGNQLSFTGAGIVTIQAVQEGNGTYAAATLPRKITVGKKELIVSADNLTRAVGQPNPVFILNYNGFVNGDTLTKEGVITAQPVFVSSATVSSPPIDDGYPVVLQGGLSANYTFKRADPAAPRLFIVSYGGSYEALIDGVAHDLVPVGKLELTVAARGLQYSGTVRLAAEAKPITVRGTLAPSTDLSGADHTFVRAGSTTLPALELAFTITEDGKLHGVLKRGDADAVPFADGVRLGVPAAPLGAGAHTLVLGPGIDSSDTTVVPGHGHATASIAAKTASLKLNGKLADGAPLTASLKPAADRSYRLWVNPYKKRLESFLAGRLSLEAHPETGPFFERYYIPADAGAVLHWQKAALPDSTPPAKRDATYRAGFGPLTTSVRLDPWLPPLAAKRNQTAVTLAQRLHLADDNVTGATLDVLHGEDGLDLGQLADALPTALSLDAKGRLAIAEPLTTPPNRAAWKILKFNPATGAFTGRFVLRDPPISGTRDTVRAVAFSGTFRQRPAAETASPVAEGFFLLPALDASAEKTSHTFRLLPVSE